MTSKSALIHPQAIVETTRIGEGTRVWAFAHVLPGATLGTNCNICDHVFIENDVRIGDRVTVKCGVQLWDGVELEDDVFVGPNATFTNDAFPRSRAWRDEPMRTVVRKGASIGANATIVPGITVGREAMVAAGAVVTHDVPARAIVRGNPATIEGYVDIEGDRDLHRAGPPAVAEVSRVAGIRLLQLPMFVDMRGSLAVADCEADLPFVPRRLYWIYGVGSRKVRGERAHRTLQQVLLCVQGECSVMVDDGHQREEHRLSNPHTALYVPPLVWSVQYKFSAGAVLLVLASAAYDPGDYIRDYDEFLAARQR
jgi:UDP-2-acetamido-3-amino-2,3-dideoxy-glucuronate N-acetyltransferase